MLKGSRDLDLILDSRMALQLAGQQTGARTESLTIVRNEHPNESAVVIKAEFSTTLYQLVSFPEESGWSNCLLPSFWSLTQKSQLRLG
jgi:hypothetical protein